ncbi:hypothetical protein VTK26DRAFT_7555 [Humicola hyalothermophila]
MSPFPRVDGGVGWLVSRDDTRWMSQNNFTQNNFNGSRNGFFQTGTNRSTTQQMFFNELRFSAARSIRTSILILACFNILAAFATALGILCDAYFRERRNNRKFKFKRDGFSFVPEGEMYPLVLSVGIFIQSVTFAGAQSTGLGNFFGRGCTTIAQLMLPAVFLAPYIQLVFAVEIAIRALRKQPFAPRGKYGVSVCLAVVGMLTLANFLVAAFDRSQDFCLTSLFWFVAHYAKLCFALLVAVAVAILVCIVILFVRLTRSIKIDVTSRVTASRMVYYLALAVISIGFMIPFFFVQAFMEGRRSGVNALDLAMVASVVANVSGLMTGGLYLFLKSSVLSTIGPRDKAGEYEKRRAQYRVRRFDSDDSDNDSHTLCPSTESESLHRMDSHISLVATKKEEEVPDGKSIRSNTSRQGRRSPDSVHSGKLVSTAAPGIMPRAPEPARIPSASPAFSHMRKRSYSLFPRSTPASKSSVTLLPATTYSPSDNLKPPPSMANLVNFRHRRDSSLVSSATVQIGLRLSSVDDVPPHAKSNAVANDSEAHSLNCPNVLAEATPQGNKLPTRLGAVVIPPVVSGDTEDASARRDPVKDARMKTLPPVPKVDSHPAIQEPAKNQITLSPTVYSPDNPKKVKLPSPKGVGFNKPVSKPVNGAPRSSPGAPPRRRGTAETAPLPIDAKGDWI